MSVRTATSEYRGYRVEVLEWCGRWIPQLWPLDPDLPALSGMQMMAPSLEEALTKARQLIDRLLRHPPEADRTPLKPIPSPEGAEPAHERWLDEIRR